MFKIQGKYTTANVMIDDVESACADQITNMTNNSAFTNPIAIMPDCLSDDTEILTDIGFLPIKNLQKDQKIANVDINSLHVYFETPHNIIVREKRADEKIYSLASHRMGIDIISSENHRNALISNCGIKTKDLFSPLYVKDFYWSAQGLKTPSCEIEEIDALLIAWIVGDGYIKVTKNQRTDNLRIGFGIKKKRKIDRLLELCYHAGLHPKIIDQKRFTSITLNTEESKKYIRWVGREKQYPIQLLQLKNSSAIKFIEELIKIDGDFQTYKNNGSMRVNSKRKIDVEFISNIVCINYGSSIIKSRTTNNILNGKRYTSTMYYINIIPGHRIQYNRNGLHNSDIKINQIDYTGLLVCVTCSSGFFIARKNNRTFITGNCHAGKGSVIGFTMQMTDKIIPNVIGVDIGCGVLMSNIGKDVKHSLQHIDENIRQLIPFGMNTHSNSVIDMENDFDWNSVNVDAIKFAKIYNDKFGKNIEQYIPKYNIDWFNLLCYKICISNSMRVINSIGTLGGGNHAIELGVSKKTCDNWMMIHTGSRNLGKKVCEYWQNIAINVVKASKEKLFNDTISNIRKTNIGTDISDKILAAKEKFAIDNPPDEYAYLEGAYLYGYLFDMIFCQHYAKMNRMTIANLILSNVFNININDIDTIECIHNFIDFRDLIIRKGSIRAYKNERVCIPLNMRDGVIIGEGKSNPEFNYSGPHGAGRLMSRTNAKKNINMEDFKNSMDGIYSSSVNEFTLDESPMAYKDSNIIIDAIQPTVDIIDQIVPILNLKDAINSRD